jgi:transposase
MKKQFTQAQKLSVIEKGSDIGIKKAAVVAGVHYSTVYDWKRQFEALGKDAFLAYQPSRPGRGIKIISKQQEASILDTWKKNPG